MSSNNMSDYDQQGYTFPHLGESFQDTAVSALFTDTDRAVRLSSAIEAARSRWENSLHGLEGGSAALFSAHAVRQSLEQARQAACFVSDALGGARTRSDLQYSSFIARSLVSAKSTMVLVANFSRPHLQATLYQMVQEFDQSMKPYHEALACGTPLPQAIDQKPSGQIDGLQGQDAVSMLVDDEEIEDASWTQDQKYSEDDDVSAFGNKFSISNPTAFLNTNADEAKKTPGNRISTACSSCQKSKTKCVAMTGDVFSTCMRCAGSDVLRSLCNRGQREEQFTLVDQGIRSRSRGRTGSHGMTKAGISEANERLDKIEQNIRALWLAKKGRPLPDDLTRHSSWTESN